MVSRLFNYSRESVYQRFVVNEIDIYVAMIVIHIIKVFINLKAISNNSSETTARCSLLCWPTERTEKLPQCVSFSILSNKSKGSLRLFDLSAIMLA